MLRHIRMTCRVEPFRIPTKLASLLRDQLRSLYPIVVPHRTPTIGEPDPICACRYPIYTLCTPEPSPYDISPAPAAATAAVTEIAASESTAPVASAAAAAAAAAAPLSSCTLEPLPEMTASTAAATVLAGGAPTNEAESAHGRRRRHAEARVAKTRPVLRVRKLWRGRERPEVYHSNVIPNRPTCYRCDICDGFQDVREEEEMPEDKAAETVGNKVRSTSSPPPTADHTFESRASATVGSATVSASSEAEIAQGVQEDEEDEESEEFSGRPVSTDIANTIMEDTAVAELRYLDPFLVEILGRPHMGTISRTFNKQFTAQLARCGLTVKDLVKRACRADRNGRRYSAAYDQWIAQQQHGKARAARDRRGGATADRVAYLKQKTELLDIAAYTVRFALAAYGLPYELGYFNSVMDVMKVQAEPHRRYTCATSEEQMESMRRMLQGEEPNELMEFAASRYSVSIGKPCYSIVLDHQASRVILAFRGSLTMADVVVDIAEGYAEIDLLPGGARVVVGGEGDNGRSSVQHEKLPAVNQRRYGSRAPTLETAASEAETVNAEGTDEERVADSTAAPLEAARTRVPLGFYEAVREAAQTLLPALAIIHRLYPTYELLVTGHSLGGIEAALFHLLYCFPPSTAEVKFPRVQTITFGAAPIVEEHILGPLNAALAEEERRSGSRLVHFSYGKDFVARLHVRSILQALTEKEEASPDGTASVNPGTMPDLSVLPRLALPGSCYNMPHRLRRGFFAVNADCPWRGQVILSAEAVFHHFPPLYARAINRLLHYYTKRLAEAEECDRKECG